MASTRPQKTPQSERLNVMVDILKHVKPTPNRKDVFTKLEANKKKILAVEKRIAKRAAEMVKEQVGIQSLWQGYQNKMVFVCVTVRVGVGVPVSLFVPSYPLFNFSPPLPYTTH